MLVRLQQEYQMTDAEANTIMPCIIEKSGHNQVTPLIKNPVTNPVFWCCELVLLDY